MPEANCGEMSTTHTLAHGGSGSSITKQAAVAPARDRVSTSGAYEEPRRSYGSSKSLSRAEMGHVQLVL